MVSSIKRDFVVEKGVARFPMKEYPNWYGIEGVGFISHGEWSDPEIEYNGIVINSSIIEDTMWEYFIEEYPEYDDNYEEFAKYMQNNKEEVLSLLSMYIETLS